MTENRHTFDSESRLAGSAGMVTSTVRVSTHTTPTGIPPKLIDKIKSKNTFSNI